MVNLAQPRLTGVADVRLSFVDTPERGQKGYQEAKDYTATFVGQAVHVNVKGLDKYDRFLGEVILSNGSSLNKLLLDKGLAKVYGT
jgi:micrococcal nuclease